MRDGFLGLSEGDFEVDLLSMDTGGGGGMVLDWLIGCGGIMDMRFIRRVSVGLMVLAPKPLACEEWPVPGIIEVLLFPVEGAARPPRLLILRRGERVAKDRRFDSTP